MTKVVIHRSGWRGGGIVIALIMLAVLRFAKSGPTIGRIQNGIEREQADRERTAKILRGNDIRNLKKAFEGADNAAKKLLESLPKDATDEGSAVPESN
jgi:hypothetical protein